MALHQAAALPCCHEEERDRRPKAPPWPGRVLGRRLPCLSAVGVIRASAFGLQGGAEQAVIVGQIHQENPSASDQSRSVSREAVLEPCYFSGGCSSRAVSPLLCFRQAPQEAEEAAHRAGRFGSVPQARRGQHEAACRRGSCQCQCWQHGRVQREWGAGQRQPLLAPAAVQGLVTEPWGQGWGCWAVTQAVFCSQLLTFPGRNTAAEDWGQR